MMAIVVVHTDVIFAGTTLLSNGNSKPTSVQRKWEALVALPVSHVSLFTILFV